MGKKSTPEIPESYDLEELLKYNTDLNRYDAVNPFGTQKWSENDNGKWTMTQAIDPEMQSLLDTQFDFIKQGPSRYETPQPMQDMQQALMERKAAISGATPGYSPDVPASGAPLIQPRQESMMPGAEQPAPTSGPVAPTSGPVPPGGMMPGQEGGPTGDDVLQETGFVMPGHTTTEEPGWQDRLAAAMQAANGGEGYQVGQNGYGIGSAIGAAIPGLKEAYDKYKNKGGDG